MGLGDSKCKDMEGISYDKLEIVEKFSKVRV